jgi:broad specificity phosphatase PhoE
MNRIVFLRNRQTTSNPEKRITGSNEDDISLHGLGEARAASRLVRK